MEINPRRIILTIAVFIALLAIVIAVAALSVRPAGYELVALGGFLLFFGGITLGASIGIGRSGLPAWIHSIRGQLLLVSIIVAVLGVINIGFVSYLMFIPTHELGLLLGLVAFSAGLSVILSLYLSRPTTRNVQKVIEAVREMEAGSLEVSVPVESKDEIGELATAFNEMAGRFRESLSRERSLEKSRRELVEAVSHDLRTPLSSLRAVIESINDGVVTDEETIKRYLQTAQVEVEYLSQLVNDLFELSRIDAGLLKLKREPVSLGQLIAETIDLISPQASQLGLSVKGNADDDLPTINADRARLQRALYNLAQNAVFHTSAGGSVRIGASDMGDTVEVQVADTGEGIPEQDLPRIFERSYWLNGGSRRTRGTGLGLSIARGIVEAHGGNIRATSRPGTGSVFSFTLPR